MEWLNIPESGWKSGRKEAKEIEPYLPSISGFSSLARTKEYWKPARD